MPLLIFVMCTALRILLQVLGFMLGPLCLLRTVLKSEDRAGLHVSFPEGMVSCRLQWEHGLLPWNCQTLWVLHPSRRCKGCKRQSCQRAVSAVDVDDVQCLHVSILQACSVSVLASAAHALEGLNLELCLSLCMWWVL